METITAFFAAFTMVLITQILRQLLPNVVAYPWQSGLCFIVPKNFRDKKCFNNKDSLLFFSEDEKLIHIFSLKSQSNLRNIVLIFGLSFFLFTRVELSDIQQGWEAVVTLLVVAAMVQFTITIALKGADNFDPDRLLHLLFNVSSMLFALDFILVNFK
jgi:hypothetical protein